MASPSDPSSSSYGITIQYERNRVSVYAGRYEKVGEVIVRARDMLKLPTDKRYTLLNQGTRLADDVTVEAALANNRTTVLFLQMTTDVQIRTGTLHRALSIDNNKKYGFCKSVCKLMCEVRPIFKCAVCKQASFVLSGEIDFFNDESLRNASGTCSNENCASRDSAVNPSIEYICRSCELPENTVPFLRHIRSNFHKLPCMKCANNEEVIIRFGCESSHTMCLKCFIEMCKILFDTDQFKMFEVCGYSVPCPGPGPDCQITPLLDPHHYYIIDNNKEFYAKFQSRAFAEYIPPGDNIFCIRCKVEVDMNRAREVAVTRPACDAVNISGGFWFSIKKLFSRPEPPPAPRMRQQVSCVRCSANYCCVCKEIWHEGDCIELSNEAEREAKRYVIDPQKAKASCWPKQ